MSYSGGLIDFESSWKKAEQREQTRANREKILEKARDKAERLDIEKEKERKWMNPDLEKKLSKELKKKKKKKDKKAKKEKKKKKEKKSKKSKKSKKDSSSDSSSSESENEENQWVEKNPEPSSEPKSRPENASSVKRDSWMEAESERNYDPFTGSISRSDILRKSEQKKEERRKMEEERAKIANSRELNPNLRANLNEEPKRSSTSSAAVGDGGVSWLKRAYKRAEERAKAEGKSIEEIAAQRWGSIEKFNELLAKAEAKARGVNSDDPRSARQDDQRSGRDGDQRSRPRRSRSRSRERRRSRDRRRSRSRDRRSRSRERSFAKPSEDGEQSRSEGKRDSSRYSKGSWKTSDRKDRERERSEERREERRKKEDEESRRRRRSTSSSSSSSSSEDEKPAEKAKEEPPKEKVEILTQEQLNALGAKILKAEMMGNKALAEKLKAKLEKAKADKLERLNNGNVDPNEEEEVVLTRTDSKGISRPISSDVLEARAEKGRKRSKKVKPNTHDKSGQRTHYFPDDDKTNLKQMFESEKTTSAADQNAMLARLAGKGMETTDADNYDMDDVFMARAASAHESSEKSLAKERERAIAEHKKLSRKLDECKFCFGSPNMAKHLMIAVGDFCYLALPHHQSLSEGHCFIVPNSHVKCGTLLDENVVAEMNQFRKALVRMFAEDEDESEDCVFFESAIYLNSHPHMILECVPIPRETGEMAPMYFQKAIQECEKEWSDNKKLISLREKGGDIRRAVPKGLPYFFVDFGMDQAGFAHVVEDEKDWPRYFGQEIIGGMLDVEPRLWRNPRKENFEVQRDKVLKFGAKWKKYDFTGQGQSSDSSSEDSD